MKNQDDIVIVSAARTPFSKFDSAMSVIPSIDLGVMVMKEVVHRVGLNPADIDEITYGSCVPAEIALESNIPARQATLLAGFPAENISLTIDRACCTSLTCLRLGMRAIRVGDAEIAMAVGSENMPRTPHLAPGLRKGVKLGHITLIDCMYEIGYPAKGFNSVAIDAGEIAVAHGVTREMQDVWAMGSQDKYARAFAEGKFKVGEEITPVVIPQKNRESIIIDKDESPRKVTLEGLARLETVYGSPTVTAGNAPPLSAGSSAILFMTRKKAEEKGLKPLATIVASVTSAMPPRMIAEIPAYTIQKALDKAGMTLEQMDMIEINEAFAAVTLTSTKMLARDNEKKWQEILKKTNVNGGAIAIGHPMGASGARLAMHMVYELRRRGGGYGMAAICGGLAQGESVILRVDA